ncbi:MAG: SMP-30/gluconolactonase/LRE family protein [Solirubrobacteraceae bacterium]
MTESDARQVGSDVLIDGLHFPECLRWHDGRLFFCDMYGDAVYAYDTDRGELETVAEVFHPGGIGWLPDGRMLVVASEDHWILDVSSGRNEVYADLSETAPGWLNDMLIDDDGRIYVGNFGYDLFSEEPRSTRLVLVDADGSTRVQADDVLFPNGMAKRSDGCLVLAETFAKALTTFTIEQDGNLRRKSSLPLGEAIPDGICVDAEDNIWIASVYDRAAIRVSPSGEMESHPVSQMAFACVLGGEDGRTLFVASAPDFEPAERRAQRAGLIETIRVPVPMAGA